MRVNSRNGFEHAIESGKKELWIQKYPDTCGRDLNLLITRTGYCDAS